MNTNPYKVQLAKIINIKEEVEAVKLFRLVPEKKFSFLPGQFVELSIPGYGEAPFAVCSDPFEKKFFELCVRKAGVLTEKLHKLKVGDAVGIRGPYGRGWPIACAQNQKSPKDPLLLNKRRGPTGQAKIKNTNFLLVAGGLGLVPLRPLILAKEKLFGKESKIQLFCGAKSPRDFLFQGEHKEWSKVVDLNFTIDKECEGWKCDIGLVTTLFDKIKVVENARAFLCGPPIMYRFVLEKLKEHNFKDEDIFMSLERRMHCAVGVCQHCAVGSKYVCKDGPVFSRKELKNINGAI